MINVKKFIAVHNHDIIIITEPPEISVHKLKLRILLTTDSITKIESKGFF